MTREEAKELLYQHVQNENLRKHHLAAEAAMRAFAAKFGGDLEHWGLTGLLHDMDWEQTYLGRTEHPKSEAENVLLTNDGKISRIQKNISNSNGKIGEFIGIMKLSDKGSNIFVDKFENLQKSHKGPFHNANSLDQAYLTDMIQELLDSKIDVTPIFVSGKWCEIDTLQDLNQARNLFSD